MAIKTPFEATASGTGPDADAVRAFATWLVDAAPVEQITGAELVERTQALEILGRVVEAQQVLCAGEVEVRSEKALGQDRLSAKFGCRSDQELLERATQASGPELMGRKKLARQVRASSSLIGETLPARFPAIAAAFHQGLLGVETAEELVKALAAAEPRANPFELAAAEELLVTEALGLTTEPDADPGPEAGPDDPDPDSDPDTDAPDAGVDDADAGSDDPGSDADSATDAGVDAGADAPDGGLSVVEWIAGLSPEGERSRVRPTFRDVKRRAQLLREVLDPDGPEPAADRAQESRFFTIGQESNGLVSVRGKLMPETAAQFTRLMDACLNPAANHTPATIIETPNNPAGQKSTAEGGTAHQQSTAHHVAATQGGADAASADDEGVLGPVVELEVLDPRRPGQKRHDVLTSMLNAAARAGELPSLGGDNATLVVHVEEQDLVNPQGTAILEGVETKVPARIAHRLTCTGAVQKVVFGKNHKIVALGSKERVFTAQQRRAITARDGGCLIPGCSIPASWCEVHHVIPWAEGGPTHVDNGVLLCWWHHHYLESSGWEIRMNNGVPYVKAPFWVDPAGKFRRPKNYTTGTTGRPNLLERFAHGEDSALTGGPGRGAGRGMPAWVPPEKPGEMDESQFKTAAEHEAEKQVAAETAAAAQAADAADDDGDVGPHPLREFTDTDGVRWRTDGIFYERLKDDGTLASCDPDDEATQWGAHNDPPPWPARPKTDTSTENKEDSGSSGDEDCAETDDSDDEGSE